MGRLVVAAVMASALAACEDSGSTYIPVSYTPTYKRTVPANAQASSQAWYLRCRGERPARKTCVVETNVDYIGRYRQNVVTGTFAYDARADRFVLALGSPPTSVRVRVDDNAPQAMRCAGRTCVLAAQPLLTQMQGGYVLRLDVRGNGASYPEPQAYSLWGFPPMLEAALREAAPR